MNKGGIEKDSKDLGQNKNPKFQDKCKTNLEFEELSKARKRIPQKQGDLELQSEEQGKNQT